MSLYAISLQPSRIQVRRYVALMWVGVCSVASVVSISLQPYVLWPTRLLCPWDSPARIVEWVAMPTSSGSSPPRNLQRLLQCRQIFHSLSHLESPCS